MANLVYRVHVWVHAIVHVELRPVAAKDCICCLNPQLSRSCENQTWLGRIIRSPPPSELGGMGGSRVQKADKVLRECTFPFLPFNGCTLSLHAAHFLAKKGTL